MIKINAAFLAISIVIAAFAVPSGQNIPTIIAGVLIGYSGMAIVSEINKRRK